MKKVITNNCMHMLQKKMTSIGWNYEHLKIYRDLEVFYEILRDFLKIVDSFSRTKIFWERRSSTKKTNCCYIAKAFSIK